MDINEAIEMLETAGFHLYRRVVNGPDLISALLVYPPVDLYAELDSLIDGVLLRYNGLAGDHAFKCTDPTILQNTIRTQIQCTMETWDEKGLPPAYPDLEAWFQGSDLKTIQQLKQMTVEHGHGIEAIWLTRKAGFKCLYRGAVIGVNDKLMTAISVDGKRIAIPLKIGLALLDEIGGLEEQQIAEPEALEA
jgi:hypothetical protein